MGNKETVCAVVVTYNRKELLTECLDALMNQTRQLDAIYLIDNFSNDGTAELLLENEYIDQLPPANIVEPWEKEYDCNNSKYLGSIDNRIDVEEAKIDNVVKIYYVRMNENTGGSGGFHEGTKRAYDRGFDWLWLMDDDAEPYKNSIELLNDYFDDDNIVALANSVIKPNNEIDLKHRGLIDFNNMFPYVQQPIILEHYNKKEVEIHVASFVGLLVSSKAIKKIGFPIKDFFIHNDDIEYCLRLMQVGKLILVPQSKIIHKEVSNPGKSRTPYDKLWLQYYGGRNLITLANKYSTNKIKFYIQLFIGTSKKILVILLFDDNKFKRIVFTLSSVFDGIFNKIDNNKPKKILYK